MLDQYTLLLEEEEEEKRNIIKPNVSNTGPKIQVILNEVALLLQTKYKNVSIYTHILCIIFDKSNINGKIYCSQYYRLFMAFFTI